MSLIIIQSDDSFSAFKVTLAAIKREDATIGHKLASNIFYVLIS